MTDRVWGAPDLVIEVLSPTLRLGRADERLSWFARYGVRECWFVSGPLREIQVLSFAGGEVSRREVFEADEPVRSSVLPGLILAPRDVLDER